MSRQDMILRLLYEHGELSGRDLRSALNVDRGWWFRTFTNSGPSFYYLMSRMEDLELVQSRNVPFLCEGEVTNSRYYRLTEETREQLRAMKEIRQDIQTL